ncbi:hypothetical protein ACS5NO_05195 [Larkinella sp. GY13]|uniref:hypothetical protein n=1 Tax=Larkinella sp. GY13 TaxID=3453720 RepID=UPI003EEDE08E
MYNFLKLSGFDIRLNQNTIQEKATSIAIELLDSKLREISNKLEPNILPILQKVPIWIEWKTKEDGAMWYHIDINYLINNGISKYKVKSIEINNIQNFIYWVELNQPNMVLHELAHAYHDLILGFDNRVIKMAYKCVKEEGIYNLVHYHEGNGNYSMKEAYAITNEREYFSELTEAYFGTNDYFPFTRTDLQLFDPLGYDLMKTIWK